MFTEVNVTTDAVSEPISTAEAKAFLRVDGSDEDTLIDECVSAARRYAEEYTQRSFTAKTYTALFSDLQKWEDEFDLPYPPTASITSVHRVNSEGTETELVLNTGYYKRGLKDVTIRPIKQFNVSQWHPDSYKVVFVSDATQMTAEVKMAMYKLIADFYENRQNERDEAAVLVNYDSKRILDKIKRNHFV